MSNQKVSLLPQKEDKDLTLTCFGACGKEMKTRYFYRDFTGASKVGYIPYCKDCMKAMCIGEDGKVSTKLFLDLLKNPVVDKPFLNHIWEAHKNAKDPVGAYFRAIGVSKVAKEMRWADGDTHLIPSDPSFKGGNSIAIDAGKYVMEKLEGEDEVIVVSAESVRIWGVGFEPEQYVMLDELYAKLSRDFEIDTGVQEEYLQNACICQMRNKVALSSGNVMEAEKWGKQFDSYMASGKLKPNQISNSDRMGGITNFSTFFQYIEKSENFIPDFPDIMLDDIDFAIYTILNYIRTLMGVPPITLGEVKNFTTYEYERGQEIIFPNVDDGETRQE